MGTTEADVSSSMSNRMSESSSLPFNSETIFTSAVDKVAKTLTRYYRIVDTRCEKKRAGDSLIWPGWMLGLKNETGIPLCMHPLIAREHIICTKQIVVTAAKATVGLPQCFVCR